MDESAAEHRSFGFLFTDIEGSTRLWEQFPEEMARDLTRHDALLRSAVRAHRGQVYRSAGDAVQAIFPDCQAAMLAALEAQQELTRYQWLVPGGLRVRMAIHVADAERTPGGDYRSPELRRLEATLATAHGGQILLTSAASEHLQEAPLSGADIIELGMWHLPEIGRSEPLFQVVHEALPSAFPALNAAPATAARIQSHRQRLIGRGYELRELHALLGEADGRLVTLTGPGGIGKTRIAQQLAAEIHEKHGANVWFVDLTGLSDFELVISAIASTMQLREVGHASVFDAVADALQQTEVVLILDNFEHLLPAAGIVADLLARAPRLRVVVTSRIPLRIRGERQVPVEALSVPPASFDSWEELQASEAVQLFVDHASMAAPAFSLGWQNASAVVGICRKLEGVPLAIELAAPRVRQLPIDELNQRLDDLLSPLSTPEVNLPDRHRAMRVSIDWSYELLSPIQQWFFRQLGVLQSGFTLETLEGLFAADVDTLDLVEGLVEQNLIQRGGFQRDPDRFFMLESVRQYALERLELAGETTGMRARHARYFSETMLARFPDQRSIDAEAVALLGPSRADLRIAIAWWLEHDPDQALALAASAWRLWFLAGELSDGDRWLNRVLDATVYRTTIDRVRALNGRAILRHAMADIDRAIVLDQESLTLAEAIGDQRGRGDACNHMAGLIAAQGKPTAESHRLIDRALAAYARVDDQHGVAESRINLMALCYFEEHFAEGLAQGLLAIEYCRSAGKDVLASNLLHGVADLARLSSELSLARDLTIEALELNRRLHFDVFTSANISVTTSLLLRFELFEDALRLAEFARRFSSEYAPGGDIADPFGRVDAERAEMLAHLPPDAAARAIAAGQRLTAAGAVDQALELLRALEL